MTKKIGYNKFPNFDEFRHLYEKMSQQELANHYQCTKKRINKWIQHFGLPLRSKGGGNNQKYKIDKHTLEHLIYEGFSISEICDFLNMKRSSLYGWLKKFGIKRIRKNTEYQIYQRKTRWLTEKNYVVYKHIINPNNYPRTLCGVEGGYQLDHIIGIFECFKSGISIEECASLKNLQLIPWKQNLEKRNYNNYNRGFRK